MFCQKNIYMFVPTKYKIQKMLDQNKQQIITSVFGRIAPTAAARIAERLKDKGVVNRYGKPYTTWSILPVLRGHIEHIPTEIALIEIVKEELSNYQAEKTNEIMVQYDIVKPQKKRPMKKKKKMNPPNSKL